MNKDKLDRAVEIVQEGGLGALFHSSLNYSKRAARNCFWKIKGRMRLGCCNADAYFNSTQESSYRTVKKRFKSERAILKDLINNLQANDIYFDIGASLGLHTCLPAKELTKGKVISFEPYPPNVEKLRKNIELNNLKNVELFELALSDSSSETDFMAGSTSLTSVGQTDSRAKKGDKIRTVKGDELINQGKIPRPNVVKIDVEGAEPLVIRGLKEALLDNSCRLLYIEVHLPASHRPSINDFGMDLPELKETLKKYGFELTIMKNRGDEVFVKGEK